MAPPRLPSAVPGDMAVRTVQRVVNLQSKYWKTLRPHVLDPRVYFRVSPAILAAGRASADTTDASKRTENPGEGKGEVGRGRGRGEGEGD